MLSLLFTICMFFVFGKLFFIGVKAAWGITKFVVTILLLPLILVALVIGGLIYVAFPILLVIGLVAVLD